MTKRCAKCGREFEPTPLYDTYCPACYWSSAGKPKGPDVRQFMLASLGGTLLSIAIGLILLIGLLFLLFLLMILA